MTAALLNSNLVEGHLEERDGGDLLLESRNPAVYQVRRLGLPHRLSEKTSVYSPDPDSARIESAVPSPSAPPHMMELHGHPLCAHSQRATPHGSRRHGVSLWSPHPGRRTNTGIPRFLARSTVSAVPVLVPSQTAMTASASSTTCWFRMGPAADP